jgi:hypothetical protein
MVTIVPELGNKPYPPQKLILPYDSIWLKEEQFGWLTKISSNAITK